MEGGSDKEGKVFCASPSPNPKGEMSGPRGRYFFFITQPNRAKPRKCRQRCMACKVHGCSFIVANALKVWLARVSCNACFNDLPFCRFTGKAMLSLDTRTGAICILVLPRLLKETPSFRVEELPSQQCKSDCATTALSAPDLFTRTRRFSLEQCSIVTSRRPRLRSAD